MDPDRFGRSRRNRGSSSDFLLALVFMMTLAIGVGVGVLVLGSGWTPPEAPNVNPVETRRSALFGATRPDELTGPPTATPTPLPTATPAPSPTPPPAPSQFFVVGNTGPERGTWLGRTPSVSDRLIFWPDGTQLQPFGPDTQAEGQTWRNVRDPRGNTGFVLSQHTAVVTAATPQPTSSVTATQTPGSQAYVVGNTGGDGGVWLRASPRLDDRVRILVDGTRVEAAGPDAEAEGRLWRNVRDPQGTVGYIPAEWLIPVP